MGMCVTQWVGEGAAVFRRGLSRGVLRQSTQGWRGWWKAGAGGGAGGAEGESVVHRDKAAADAEEGSQRPAWTRGGAEPPEGRTRAAAELQSPCGAVPARVQRLRQQRYHRPVERGISTPVGPG